jgi:hypothetical protein
MLPQDNSSGERTFAIAENNPDRSNLKKKTEAI